MPSSSMKLNSRSVKVPPGEQGMTEEWPLHRSEYCTSIPQPSLDLCVTSCAISSFPIHFHSFPFIPTLHFHFPLFISLLHAFSGLRLLSVLRVPYISHVLVLDHSGLITCTVSLFQQFTPATISYGALFIITCSLLLCSGLVWPFSFHMYSEQKTDSQKVKICL